MLLSATWLWVALGGAVGAMLRYSVSLWVGVGAHGFPWHTLTANVVGCFAIGAIWGLWADTPWFTQWGRYFLVVGLLGGFTTFSAFSLETLVLLEQQRLGLAAMLVLCSVGLCLLAVWAGTTLGDWRIL